MRKYTLRRLHRPDGWEGRKILYRARSPGGRERDHHRRGTGSRREAPSDPGRLLGGAWASMRILHARNDDGSGRFAESQHESKRVGNSARNRWQSLSLHGLPAHHQGRAICRGKDALYQQQERSLTFALPWTISYGASNGSNPEIRWRTGQATGRPTSYNWHRDLR